MTSKISSQNRKNLVAIMVRWLLYNSLVVLNQNTTPIFTLLLL